MPKIITVITSQIIGLKT